MVFEAESSRNVINEGKWCNRVHLPLKSREDKNLHSLYSLGLKQVSATLLNLKKIPTLTKPIYRT